MTYKKLSPQHRRNIRAQKCNTATEWRPCHVALLHFGQNAVAPCATPNPLKSNGCCGVAEKGGGWG